MLWNKLVEGSASLEQQVGDAGYQLNNDKAVSLLALRGPRSQLCTRRATNGSLPVNGQANKVARYLRAQMAADPSVRQEIHNRMSATRLAWCQGGDLWKSSLTWRLVRCLLIAFVKGTLLTELTAFSLVAGDYKLLDKTLSPFLRRAWIHYYPKQHKAGVRMNKKKVLKHWRLTTCEVEMQVRRLKRYQSWMQQPKNYTVGGDLWHECVGKEAWRIDDV